MDKVDLQSDEATRPLRASGGIKLVVKQYQVIVVVFRDIDNGGGSNSMVSVAQLVEPLVVIQAVASSNLVTHPKHNC